MGACECGCGQAVRLRFAPGHVARTAEMKAKLIEARRGIPSALAESARNTEIVRLFSLGRSMAALSRQFEITRQRIDQIVQPAKAKARAQLSRAIERGEVERGGCCAMCGATDDIEAHHDDYGLPLAVRWLCVQCHHEHHDGQRISYRRHPRRRVVRTCAGCGAGFRVTPASNRVVCSTSCRGRAQSNRISDDVLLGVLRDMAARLGRTPTSTEVIAEGPHSHLLYYKRWGSFRAACEAAGLQSYGVGSRGHRNRPPAVRHPVSLEQLLVLWQSTGGAA